ncbi:MAG: PKD domain-containing protein [Kineosporiaceae bacterium]
MWTYVGPLDDPKPDRSEWISTGSRCVRPTEAIDDAPLPALSAREFRRLPIPAGKAHIQPEGRPVLVNYPMIVYVDAEPVTLSATVLGARVDVLATPSQYTWTFGDGQTLTTTNPGGPYPVMDTTHTYERTGRFAVTLSTTYTGRYRVEGSDEWLPVTGTAQVASAPIAIEVIETRAVLVP